MPPSYRIYPFYLVIKDEDRSLFTVVGPMTDDTPWNDLVCRAQEAGREVRCFTSGRGQTRESIIRNVREQLRLEYTDEVLV